jgi:hypothetical protein
VLTDETVLNVDGLVPVDPAAGLRQRAQDFIASRQWTTEQISYADQAEPSDLEDEPQWSMNFNMGLGHIKTTAQDWFADVAAIVAFVREVSRETGSEFLVEVRYRSKPWYSEHIAFVNAEAKAPDFMREMIQRVA